MLILYFILGGESRYFNFFSENRLTLGDFMGGGGSWDTLTFLKTFTYRLKLILT